MTTAIATRLDETVQTLIDAGHSVSEINDALIAAYQPNAMDWWEISSVGARPTQTDVPRASWDAVIGGYLQIEASRQWIIGDLLNFGEAHYGETYVQAIDMTRLSYDQLAQYRSVARAFPYEMRNPELAWTYYRHIRSLPEDVRDSFVQRAIDGDIATSDELKEAIRDYKNPPTMTPHRCPSCMHFLTDRALDRGKCQACKAGPGDWVREYERLLRAAYDATCHDRDNRDLCMYVQEKFNGR